ncbi:MAG: XylR family transcriptional regulator [Planctomycetota bacterium]
MKNRSVALLLETSNAYSRGLLDGIIGFVQQHRGWSVYLPEQERGADPPEWLRRWKGDGIIARIETHEIARAVSATKLPVVDLSAGRFLENIPWLETDDRRIAEVAAEHLLERGFRNLAFCGDPGFNWSKLREQSFEACVRSIGAAYFCHHSAPRTDADYSWNRDRRGLIQWLRKLPRPIGIMACYDIKAQQLLAICREEDIAVPDEVAVIGVDNDRRLCELCDPPLSSVVPNSWKTGYESASLLDRMMRGERVSTEGRLIPPLGVKTRHSTDVLAIDDADIVAAIRIIRDQSCKGLTVHQLMRQVPMSRRIFERRFQNLLGRTPHAEIVRIRIDRCRQLLAETDLPLTEIARAAGFPHAEYLSVTFKRETGQTPREFRLEHRIRG